MMRIGKGVDPLPSLRVGRRRDAFQDWLIKAKLWLATTKVRKTAQGPMILQGLQGVARHTFKHWAKNLEWLQDEQGGHRLLAAMDQPENFGDDKEEDLLSSLAKVTYHLRRDRQEGHREFLTHQVVLPDAYNGFLLINALNLNMMNFNRGSNATKDVKEWVHKHETKLMAKEVGVDMNKNKGKTSTGHHRLHQCTTSTSMTTRTTPMRTRFWRPSWKS